jgi:hypothetical protein
MRGELERICEEAVMASFKVLSWFVPEMAEKSHRKCKSG